MPQPSRHRPHQQQQHLRSGEPVGRHATPSHAPRRDAVPRLLGGVAYRKMRSLRTEPFVGPHWPAPPVGSTQCREPSCCAAVEGNTRSQCRALATQLQSTRQLAHTPRRCHGNMVVQRRDRRVPHRVRQLRQGQQVRSLHPPARRWRDGHPHPTRARLPVTSLCSWWKLMGTWVFLNSGTIDMMELKDALREIGQHPTDEELFLMISQVPTCSGQLGAASCAVLSCRQGSRWAC
jgi:hypothetical protein